MKRDTTLLIYLPLLVLLLAAGPLLPKWAGFLVNVSLCFGTVVLGMLILMRTGLVSFGQGLYYCLGAYAAGTLDHFFKLSDVPLMILCGTLLSGLVAFGLGFLLARYRDIFFAMLSMAFSMILNGLLVKTSELGSTDGFNVSVHSFAGIALAEQSVRYVTYSTTVTLTVLVGVGVHLYLRSHLGRMAEAVRDNELRLEYMGTSVKRLIHINYVLAAALAGMGGAMMAVTVGHIDPEMAYWTTSGEFVFIAILSGTGSTLAPFLGSTVFETVRSFAYEYSPNTWQMTLGITMLLVILFLPGGLWSMFNRQSGTA